MDDDGVRQLLRHHWAEVAGGGGRLDAAGSYSGSPPAGAVTGLTRKWESSSLLPSIPPQST